MSMRSFKRAVAALLLSGLAFAACAQSGHDKIPLVANAADSKFMTRAASDGMAEVAMGRLALEKSSEAGVKQLAQRIVDDHTKANEKLQAMALAKQVALPAAPGDEAQRSASAMKALDAKKFDKAWAAAMVKDHQKAIALFSAAAGRTQDPEVRAFTRATLPTLKTHLELARQLQDQLDMPAARDEAMSHRAAMDASFDHTRPAAAAAGTAAAPAAAGSISTSTNGSH
jgi:putative membrane protein